MNKKKREGQESVHTDLFQSAQLNILISYTLFALVLIGESFLLGWEIWAVILIVIGVGVSWGLHLMNLLTQSSRIWVYSILMMCTFFFYGIHSTSTFDLAIVMSAVIVLYTLSGVRNMITLCQITYFGTMVYEILNLIHEGQEFDALVISRILLHCFMIFMIGQFAKTIIERWSAVLRRSKGEVEKLTDATDRLNDFLANVSHELRTPVNAVIGLTGICIDKEKDPEIRKDLEEVREAGHRVSDQISDILDYSEIDRNELAVNCEDYMLSSVLHDLVVELRTLKAQELELVIDVDPSIPAMMNTDVSKLKKILRALISNGLKYTKEGGVYVRITSEPQDYGVNLRIEVTDTGIGMSEEELERVTERFYQADSGRARSAGGLGLGICIVSGFVAALGGFMTISSKKGVGTKVHVSLPQKVVDHASCMSVASREKLCIGAFLHFDKYPNPNVREYYNSMVLNIVNGLGVQMHRVDNVENLRRLVESTKLTHLFVAEEEYHASAGLVEELAKRMVVAVVADDGFKLPADSWAKLLEKPFYCFPVTTILNMTLKEDQEHKDQRMMLRGVRALVVDDEPMNLTVAKSIFKRYGMVVTTALSGPESIELCRSMDFDIVFMDHMMHGMDGVEAMKRIRNDARNAGKVFPIVALTANAMSTAKQMFLAEGFDGFVSKPIELEEMERVLSKVLPKQMITYESLAEVEKRALEESENLGRMQEASEEPETQEVPKGAATGGSAMDYAESMVVEETLGKAESLSVDDVTRPADAPTSGSDKSEEASPQVGVSLGEQLLALGVNMETGLYYCNQDEDFYRMLLEQYAKETGEKVPVLDDFLAKQEFGEYAIRIHSVKSTSKMIGAEALSEGARKLEMAAKEGRGEYIEEAHAGVMKEILRITEGIRQLL